MWTQRFALAACACVVAVAATSREYGSHRFMAPVAMPPAPPTPTVDELREEMAAAGLSEPKPALKAMAVPSVGEMREEVAAAGLGESKPALEAMSVPSIVRAPRKEKAEEVLPEPKPAGESKPAPEAMPVPSVDLSAASKDALSMLLHDFEQIDDDVEDGAGTAAPAPATTASGPEPAYEVASEAAPAPAPAPALAESMVDKFKPKCIEHTGKLLTSMDHAYTDAQLKSLLTHDCQLAKQFPHAHIQKFTSHDACLKFAEKLADARDKELANGMHGLLARDAFCTDYFKLINPAPAPATAPAPAPAPATATAPAPAAAKKEDGGAEKKEGASGKSAAERMLSLRKKREEKEAAAAAKKEIEMSIRKGSS